MAISITETAAERVKQALEGQTDASALKIGVSSSGCSGYMYDLNFVTGASEDDLVFEEHGVKVIVDRKNLPFIDGLRLDWRREGLNEGFAFDNPNAKNLCGCGESFQV